MWLAVMRGETPGMKCFGVSDLQNIVLQPLELSQFLPSQLGLALSCIRSGLRATLLARGLGITPSLIMPLFPIGSQDLDLIKNGVD